jgi:hypothetical protein
MLPAATERILARLKPDDRILDVGGWAAPFRPATHVLDLMPFETRGAMGGYVEVPTMFAELIYRRAGGEGARPLPSHSPRAGGEGSARAGAAPCRPGEAAASPSG